VEEFPDLPATWCVVAVPEVGVSTPQAFRDWDRLTGEGRSNRLERLSRAYAFCSAGPSGIFNRVEGLAENHLLALVRTGIENDFEEVVFPQHPFLRDIKRELMEVDGVVYAALSGSGSAVFGLYESDAGAKAAQQRVQALGVKALVSRTIPREAYWREMFAE
jgi:4-diphosphocytidyl-2-C-methyl-D-erythritol kinase